MMTKTRGFLTGLAGGAVGAAAVLLVLVLVFGLGAATTDTVVQTRTVPVSMDGGDGLSPAQLYEDLAGGVVMVLSTFEATQGPFGEQQGGGQGLGTGFVVSKDGYILTNAHVVQNGGATADSVTVVFKDGATSGKRVDGKLVGVDADSDVAVVKVDPKGLGLKPLPLGDSDAVVVGEPVVAIGNPLGYDFSLTSGIVSATGRSLRSPSGTVIPNGIQTDAAINQGNSGGPLINAAGEVIGINEQIASQSGGNEGLGFAVPINTAKRSMEQLKRTGEVRYAWLGVAGQTLTPEIAEAFDIPVHRGAMIEEVASGGPAAKAGLRGGSDTVTVQGQDYVIGGDVITAIDGETVSSFDELIAALSSRSPGDQVELTVARDKDTLKVTATLGERPNAM